MEVTIKSEAKEYIEEKTQDKAITIVLVNTGSGWCPSFQPSVKMGKPRDEKGFKKIKSSDIEVYIKSGLVPKKEGIEITLGKFLWRKYLNVEGLSL